MTVRLPQCTCTTCLFYTLSKAAIKDLFYLIQVELFRELQLLNTDYLRQRALYSITELVTRFLKAEEEATLSHEEVHAFQTVSFKLIL